MFRRWLWQAALLLLLTGPALADGTRVFEFRYEVDASQLPTDQAVDLYVPLPVEHAGQRIASRSLDASHPASSGQETVHSNTFYHLHRAAGDDRPLQLTMTWEVSRDLDSAGAEQAPPEELQRYLEPDRLVPVGHDVLQPILEEIRVARADDSQPATARAIYDWVVDNVEYKKVGTGWGNGDTFWACSARYGNCTDFHALFVSLARSEGIPARFEIGFPVPLDRSEGQIGGYHCWVKFYLPGEGWVPIDASEAAKHPEQRELLYGTHPADRIHFTTGRDLVISDASSREPLNYFIYPHVELDGKPWQGKVSTHFSYRELPAG